MNNVTAIALNKVKTKSEEKLSVGRHHVNAVVRLTGDVVVGKDTDKKATNCLLSKEFFMMVLRASGITREAAMATIESVASSYLREWIGSDKDKMEAKEAREAALKEYDPDGKGVELFEKCAAALPRVPVSGAVKFEGEVEELDVALLNSYNINNYKDNVR